MEGVPIFRLFRGMLVLAIVTVLLYGAILFQRHSKDRMVVQYTSSDVHRRPKFIQDTSTNAKFVPPSCTRRTKLALAKVHKTGGTTLMQILHRFAYLRNLSLVIPIQTNRGSINAFYPGGLKKEKCLPPQGDHYDMFTYHFVYKRDVLTNLLGNDTFFVTILREPLSHLKSQFHFYDLAKRYRIKDAKYPLMRFLENPGAYDKKRPGYLGTRNPMSADLGMGLNVLKQLTEQAMKWQPGQPTNKTAMSIIENLILNIDQDFDLVMITEYFDEGLVMLKRLMCLDMQDILYYKTLAFLYKGKDQEVPTSSVENHKRWDIVDYHLYDYFNKSFWRRVDQIGKDFTDEATHFKELNLKVQQHCSVNDPSNNGALVIPESRWNPPFIVTHEFCTLMKLGQMCYMTLLRDRNIRFNSKKDPESPSKTEKEGVLYSKRYCALCDEISRDCTLNEYIAHLFFEKHISHFHTSFSPHKRTGRGQREVEFNDYS
ncbi:galactose-3-O-sulfotransferase 3-like [Branchiostoma floridae x Branchiostoma japonicum]